MLTKILIFLAVVIGVFVVARMGAMSAPSLGKRKAGARLRRGRRADDLVACRTCGAFIAEGETCACDSAPTP
ncbi:MAG: hypothetical protein AAF360_14675 [Pseudomonadota bacterium]